MNIFKGESFQGCGEACKDDTPWFENACADYGE
jgi:hypothetical protein